MRNTLLALAVLCPGIAQAQMVTLTIKTVTTGGTAVTALAAGQRNNGGWIQNPSTATTLLCINELGTASGTSSNGDTTCISPGQTYNLMPSPKPVSVIASDSAHAFSGYGIP
jgi:hypothetical protein